jgi:hypothetical protein
MFRGVIAAALAAAAVAAVAAVPATADKGGAGTETLTEHAHEVPLFAFPTVNQCTGAAGLLSVVAANEVFHVTTQADGDAWVTGTAEGTVTFTPEESGGVVYSGHFASWFGESLNNKNHVEHSTFDANLTGSDGSKVSVHIKGHVGTNANGVVTVERPEEVSFHCG